MTNDSEVTATITPLDETCVITEKHGCSRVGVYRYELKGSVFIVVKANFLANRCRSEIFSSLDEAMNRYQDILEFGE